MQLPIISRPKLYGSIPRINLDHPIARGLIGCYLPGTMRGMALKGPNLFDGVSSPGSRSITLDGAALRSNTAGQAQGLVTTATTPFTNWSEISVFWRGVPIGACDTSAVIIGVTFDTANGSPFLIFSIDTSIGGYTQLQVDWNTGGSYFAGTKVDVTANFGKMVSFAGTGKVGGNSILYVNGSSVASDSFGASAPTSSATSQIVVNQYDNGTPRTPNADCNAAYYWNRQLSAAEMLQLHNDPYCFLIFPEDEMFATLVGAVAAGFTWSQTGNEELLLPKAHLIREMIRHD